MYRSANSPSVGFEKNMLRFFENSENQFQLNEYAAMAKCVMQHVW